MHTRGCSYGHWIVEYLPMLYHLSRYRDETNNEVTLLINHDPPEWIVDSLKILGFDEIATEWNGSTAKVDRLLIPISSTTGPTTEKIDFSPTELRWVRSQLRQQIDRSGMDPKRRVYVSRQRLQSKRRVWNIDSIEEVLRRHDFDIVYPETLSFREQAQTFVNADVIVGPHGSGLHNIIFCKNVNIIELLHPGFQSSSNHALAGALGERYQRIIGSEVAAEYTDENDKSEKNSPVVIDPGELDSTLKAGFGDV